MALFTDADSRCCSAPSRGTVPNARRSQQVQLFINCLLASADYDSFFNVMKKEAEKSLRKKRQLGQESKPVAGEGKESEPPTPSGVPSAGECKDSDDRHSDERRSYK